MSREQIRQAALVMDPDERVALAVELFESLEPEASGVEQAWEAEIDRRVEEVEQGSARLVPAEEVFRRVGRVLQSR